MDYGSLFTTAFKTARKAPLAWLFSLCYLAYALFVPLPKNLLLLFCPQWLVVLSIFLVGWMGVTLSQYHAYLSQDASLREIWAELRRWLAPFVLFMIVWSLIIWFPWWIAFGLLRSRLPYILLLAVLALILYVLHFQVLYALLGMIRQQGSSRLFRYGWKVWHYEHGAKLLISAVTLVAVFAPRTLLMLLLYPGTSLLAITAAQYSLQAYRWLQLIIYLWYWLIIPFQTALYVSLYMQIIREHPELDLAKSPAPIAPTDTNIAPTTPTAN